MILGRGSKTALHELVEQDIAGVIAFMSDCGNPMNCECVCDLVQSFCEETGFNVPQSTINRLGVDWCQNFENRWSHVFARHKCEGLSYKRKQGLTQHNVDTFYSMFKKLVKDYNIKPENMWNCDESGFQANNGGGLLYMNRENRNNYDND